MKAPFTPFQLVMTVVDSAAFIFCMGCDGFMLTVGAEGAGKPFVVNMIFCGLSAVLFLVLALNTGMVNVFGDKFDASADPAPALSAARTYFCLLFFDLAGVLALMLAGALGASWAKAAILIFAPVVFIISAIVYFVLSGRIGLDDFADDDTDEQDGDTQ